MARVLASPSKSLLALVLLVGALLFAAVYARAQSDSEQADRSWLIDLLEEKLSTPDRQFRIRNIQGVLSSDATIGEISIADREGVWLKITNARIVWSRSSLLLGNLSIDSLGADRIDITRKPVPAEGAPAPESSGFQIPELPLSVDLRELNVPVIAFGPTVFGLQSEVSATGRLSLSGGALDTALNITRLDGPGGQLALTTTYANSSQELNLDFALSEPADGVVANLLNVEGKPPMALSLKGAGPLETLDLNLTLDADSQRVLTGTARLRREADGLGFTTNLEGPIARLIAPAYRAFFGQNTKLTATGVSHDAGGFELQSLDLTSAALALKAAMRTSADGFLDRLSLDASISDANARKVVLPVAGGESTVDRADLKLSFGETSGEQWSGNLDIAGLTSGDLSAQKIAIVLSGLAQNLNQPEQRAITFNIDGDITGLDSKKPEMAKALGKTITLDANGDWRTGQPINVEMAEIKGNGLSLNLAGTIADYVYNGTLALAAQSIAPFSALAGRDLAGGLNLDARGTIAPISGGFDLAIDGRGDGLAIGTAAADKLLQGQTRLTGRVARGEQGLVTDKLRIFNEQVDMTANGRMATGEADFTYNLALSDLGLVSDQAGGRLTAQGRAVGANDIINLSLVAAVPQGTAVGKSLRDATLGFDGALRGAEIDGKVTGSAFLDGVRVMLDSTVATASGAKRLSGLKFSAGGTNITGDVSQDKQGLLEGKLVLESADVSTAAALLLLNASGAANLSVDLTKADGKQSAAVDGTISKLAVDQNSIGSATIQAQAADLFNVPVINGRVTARDVRAGGVDVATLDATASQQGTTTNFDAKARLNNATNIATRGALAPEAGGYRIKLDALDLKQGQLAARLVEPASALVVGQNVQLDGVVLDIGGGRVEAHGSAAETLDLNIAVRAFPLAIANAVKPDLALGGMLDGTAKIGGARTQPDVQFDIRGRQLTAAALRSAGLSTLTVDARGTSSTDRLNVNATITSPEGLRASANGAVPLGDGQIALKVDLAAFPLGVLNAVVKGQDLAGTITGTADIAGTPARPTAAFRMRGADVRAAALNNAGLAPLQVTADGRFANDAVSLNAANVTGPLGFELTGRGQVPLAGSGLSVSVNGQAPLALANRFLADRGAQASGIVSVSATVSGALAQPVIRGMFSTAGAQLVDPESNLRLNNINVLGAIDGERITLRNASASLGAGGTVNASGTIGTGEGLPADIRINLNQARYADGTMVVATANGDLALRGSLTRDPTLSGRVDVVRAEISVPDGLGGAAAVDVKHIDPPPGVAATLKRAKANDGTPVPSSRPSIMRLNVVVNAPNQIFVRGRGLDAELGGSVTLTGPVSDIQPVGGFRMIRGRLGILGQRITFDEGEVTLVGDLDPFINFVARSEGSDIVVFVTVRGRVSDLDITFSSQPQLPQDEVLARLIFKRGINELSPIQIGQLAAAAAELAGGGSSSLLGSLRQATGLDDLDVVTDSEGNAAVRAGRYIQDNIYLGVEAGAGGTARGTINLDITEDLKAKGSLGSDGDSSVGIFYEKDY